MGSHPLLRVQFGLARELKTTWARLVLGDEVPLGYLEWLVRSAWLWLRRIRMGWLLDWAIRPPQRVNGISGQELTHWCALAAVEDAEQENRETAEEMQRKMRGH